MCQKKPQPIAQSARNIRLIRFRFTRLESGEPWLRVKGITHEKNVVMAGKNTRFKESLQKRQRSKH